jgi:hypothetical protein
MRSARRKPSTSLIRKDSRLYKHRKLVLGKNYRAEKSRVLGVFLRILIPLAIIGAVFLFVKLRTLYWNGSDKLGFAFRTPSGDVGVTVADPHLDELTTLVIPGDTQVDVAENYGTLRIKNVWQLSQNERLKGKLLPETVTQNFLFPVFLWSDEVGESLEAQSVNGVLKFIFNPSQTNIPFGDRVNLALFALRVPSLGKTEINLGESQFLKKQKLNDGLPGYILNGEPSSRLTVYFADNDLAVTGAKVDIVDATGTPGVADKVGQIVEVMGGKVVTVEKKDADASDCVVNGLETKVVKKVQTLFGCKTGVGKSNFDLEIRLGENFAKRF